MNTCQFLYTLYIGCKAINKSLSFLSYGKEREHAVHLPRDTHTHKQLLVAPAVSGNYIVAFRVKAIYKLT